MPGQLTGHDSATAIPDRDATSGELPAALLAALRGLTVEGAVFLYGEYTEPWSYESPAARPTADLLHPGRDRVTLFHLVSTGRAWVQLVDGERHWASEGDVIVLPYGDQHRMGGTAEAECVSIFALLDPPPWDAMPVIRYGAGGSRTDVLCGYLVADDPLFDPALKALPPLFVVTPPPEARSWVTSTIDYAIHQTTPTPGGILEVPPHLLELLVVEVLRLHLAGAPAVDRGWVAALGDEVLAPAMAAIHDSPDRKWTVAELARRACVSASLLDERFRRVLGLAPIRYLTEWRMHVAEELLRSSDLPVAAVATRVGYDAEEAFSRAFKRSHALSPAHWRARR